jgi:hypothetical protein
VPDPTARPATWLLGPADTRAIRDDDALLAVAALVTWLHEVEIRGLR